MNDPIEDLDTEPTERFIRQSCPHCAVVASVPLSLAVVRCESCGEGFNVAPLDLFT